MDTRNSKFRQGFVRKVRGVERFGFMKCSRDFLGSLLTLQEVGNLPTQEMCKKMALTRGR